MDLQELEWAWLYAQYLGLPLVLSDPRSFQHAVEHGRMLEAWGPPPPWPDKEPF